VRTSRLLPFLTLALVLVALPATGAETVPRGEWPLAPRPEVVSAFDPPAVVWGSGHRGVDLGGTVGQQVHAALPGRISFVGRIAGVGVVVVDHGATRTTYQPVSADVRVGRQVAGGAAIGSLEWYGSHCLPAACLHWGLVRGETYLDPLTLVDAPSPVRLFPLGAAPSAAPGPGPAARFVPPTLPGLIPWS
jgi:murein DD-endopeptidase MepM/ murein hydrolase activator NlpD